MASAPPNSLLARSRSLRSASNRNPPVAAATATATATPQAAATPTITPNLSIFLTNLRLLDFDSYPDWPAFDAQTFAIQKRRIQSVEWALFQLFALWDPEETRVATASRRVSLTHVLRRKNEARRRYKDLSELLDIKERSTARRQAEAEAEACRANGPGEAVSADAVLDMRRMLRNKWTGSERWMETLLQGDASARHDGVLSAPFDRVWRRVETGRLSELEDHGKGLLEQLEGRVKAQRESLQKWQNFQQKMFGRQPDVKPLAEAEKRKERGINLGFGAHETLHLGQFPVTEKLSLQAPELDPVHASILDDCKKDLAQIGVVRRTDIRSLLGPRLREPTRPDRLSVGTDGGTEEGVSEISEWEEEEEEEEPILEAALPPKPAHRRNNSQSSAPSSSQRSEPPADPPQELSRRSSNRRPVIHRNTSSITKDRPVVNLSRFSSQGSHSSGSRTSDRPRSRSPEKPTRPSIIIEPERTPSPEPPSPTQNMADQILDSMAAASPSPVKQNKPRHTLSLAERTRMSMARMSFGGKAFTPEDEDELDFRTLPIRPAPMATPTEEEDEATLDLGDSALDDLASRTRKSMAGFEAARKKAQLDRRRSQRQSRLPPPPRQEGGLFPKVEEETTQLDVDASVLADELIQGEDMEAVFKSRPRLQTSPAASPRRPIESDEYL
ncbi:COPII coat assembly protein sec-16 [Verticillium dahliae VDG1]|nr:COPII coat assembly protein sec-16 [Verticillium dahliae VDG1]